MSHGTAGAARSPLPLVMVVLTECNGVQLT